MEGQGGRAITVRKREEGGGRGDRGREGRRGIEGVREGGEKGEKGIEEVAHTYAKVPKAPGLILGS